MHNVKFKKILNMISYFALVFVAAALSLALIFHSSTGVFGEISMIIAKVAEALAYTVVAVYAYFYVRSKRSAGYKVLYFLGIALAVVFLILPLVK